MRSSTLRSMRASPSSTRPTSTGRTAAARRSSGEHWPAGATGWCWRRSSAGSASRTACRAACAPTSAGRSRTPCGGCRRTGSISTSTTAPTAPHRSRRRSAPWTSSSERGRCARSARRTSRRSCSRRPTTRRPPRSSHPSPPSRASTRCFAATLRRSSCRRAIGSASASFPTSRSRAASSPARYRRDRQPEPGTRLHGREIDDADLERVEQLEALARELGVSLLEVAIGSLLAQPAVVSVIAGATKPEQVRANAAAAAWQPTAEQLETTLAAVS